MELPLDTPGRGTQLEPEASAVFDARPAKLSRGKSRLGGHRPVIVKTCTSCRSATPDALSWVVAAWQRADGVRVAYKHKLGLCCIAAKIAPLQVHSDNNVMTCPNCGIDTSVDYDAVYITWIPKGVGKLQAECPFCNACAAHFRIWFQEGAEELEDRNRVIEGRPDAPRYDASQVLASLGIQLPVKP